MSKKDRVWMTLGLVVGIGMMIFGPIHAFSEVKCHNQKMEPGDTCATTHKRSTTVRSFEEYTAYQRRMGLIIGGVGVFLTAGSSFFLIKRH